MADSSAEGPLVKKGRTSTDFNGPLGEGSLADLLPDDLFNSDHGATTPSATGGSSNGRSHLDALLNGTSDLSTSIVTSVPSQDPSAGRPPSNSGPQRQNVQLTQLLANTPTNQPMPFQKGLDMNHAPPASSPAGNQISSNPPHSTPTPPNSNTSSSMMMNARASPALQNAAVLRQSPQLARTSTPGGHPTMSMPNGPGSVGSVNGPSPLHMFHNNVPYSTANDVSNMSSFQQQNMRMPFPNNQMMNGPGNVSMNGMAPSPHPSAAPSPGMYGAVGQNAGQVMQNGIGPGVGYPNMQRTPSSGNLTPAQQQQVMAAAAAIRGNNPNMRMPGLVGQRPNMQKLTNAGQLTNGQTMQQPGMPQTRFAGMAPQNFSPPGSVQSQQSMMSPVSQALQDTSQQQLGNNMMGMNQGLPNSSSSSSLNMLGQQGGQYGGPPSVGKVTAQMMSGQLSPTNSVGNVSGDPEKRKIIQQQLVLLLHAHKCQRREMQPTNDGQKRECTLPHCRTMKGVLTHMTQCTAGKACQMPHCASSRQIIQHWKTCCREDCPVCLPLKQASDRSRPTNDFTAPQQMMSGNVLNGPGQVRPGMFTVNGPVPNAMVGGGGQRGPTPNNGQLNNRAEDFAGLGISNGPAGNNFSQGSSAAMHNSQLDNLLSSPPMGQGTGTFSQAEAAHLRASLMNFPTGNSPHVAPIQFDPTPTSTHKDWHGHCTIDLRNHLIHKLVQAIFPYKDHSALLDKRMHNLICYARKVEAEMYESADTREAYYQLLAEKIYKIQKELEDKRNRRQNERRQPGMTGDPNQMGNMPQGGMTQMMNASNQIRPNMQMSGSISLDQFGQPAQMVDSNGNPIRFSSNQSMPFPGSTPVPGAYANSGGFAMPSMNNQPSTSMNDPLFKARMDAMNNFRLNGPNSNVLMNSGGDMRSSSSMDDLSVYEIKSEGPGDSMNQGSSPKVGQNDQGIKSEPSSGSFNNEVPVKDEMMTGIAASPMAAVVPAQPASAQSSANDSVDGAKSEQADMELNAAEMKPNVSKDVKIVKKVYEPAELQEALMPVLERLYQQDPEGHPFRIPVDPVSLQIHDYFDIIKTPMDLSSIKRKLESGQYEDPWQFIDDMWLMFNNAWLYNRKGSKVYKYCSKLSEIFETDIDPVMQSLGYCCGRRYVFQPQILCCYGKQLCTIPRDTTYLDYQNRYMYCQRCFTDIPGDTVSLGDEPSMPTTVIKKELFIQKKNDQIDYEPFVTCKHCGRKNHQICVLHMDQIWPESFVCEPCQRQNGQKRKDNRFTAKKLPQTKLGQHIESHINSYLYNKQVTEAGEVTIRVLSSSDKVVEVKPGMKHKFVDAGEISETFPYRTKAIFAFEEIDGTDVCFFGMHVQEYGSDCPTPNSRRIYIAYLDSVHFFRPKYVRTAVYHEILLSYIAYCKNLGYSMAHIWACPPSEGDDYIFHCHPPEQKIPKPKRLQEWYKKMLDKGINDGIITEYKDILKHSMEDSVGSATEIPYFEGDFWPNVIEECIKEVEQLELQEKEQRQSMEDSDDSDETMSEPGKGKKRPKKSQANKKQKSSQKSSGRKANKKIHGISAHVNTLTQKIFNTMDKHKDVFFVGRLHTVQRAATLQAIVDPDPLISCELMDGRDAFLTMARDRHYEFSSLRRTKFSSMAMLYELHNQGQDRFIYTCNSCKAHVETRYHCTVCDDYDLCIRCYEKDGHPHKMDKLGLDLDDGMAPKDSASNANPADARMAVLQRFMQSLVHCSQCRDANCRLGSCIRMKKMLAHTKQCKRKLQGGCAYCKQLLALCCLHAKQCNDAKCTVPFCGNIKQKMKIQRQQHDVQRAMFNRRRAGMMNHIRMVPSGAPPTTSNSANTSVPSPPSSSQLAPGIGMKTVPGSAERNIMDTVNAVKAHALHQATAKGGKGSGGGVSYAPQFSVGKSSIVGGGLNLQENNVMRSTPEQFNKPVLGQSAPVQQGGLPPLNQQRTWDNQQPIVNGLPGLQAGQGVPNRNMMSSAGGQIVTQLQNAVNLGGGASNLANMQLLEALRQPASSEQQQQVSNILRGNPQLMAMFIRHTRTPRPKEEGQQQVQQQPGGGVRPQGPTTMQMQQHLQQQQLQQQLQQQQQQQQQQGQNGPHNAFMSSPQSRMVQPGQPVQMGMGQQGQMNQLRPSMPQYQNVPAIQQQQQQGGLQGQQQFQPGQMMNANGQRMPANFHATQAGNMGSPQQGMRPRFLNQGQQQPGQQPGSAQYQGMGPPVSYYQSSQQQPGDMMNQNYSVGGAVNQGPNALAQQQQQRNGPSSMNAPTGRSPGASALPVRSPSSQPSPAGAAVPSGRQSTPGPALSQSPRPLSGTGNTLHPSSVYDPSAGSDALMQQQQQQQQQMQQQQASGGQHGHLAHHMDFNGHPMGMNMPGHYGHQHHHNTSLTPSDHLNKFVDNL